MHDTLFEHQKQLADWVGDDVRPDVGLDDATYRACLKADRELARVTADAAEAKRLGVTGTPAIFVGKVRPDGGIDLMRRLPGALPAETIVNEVAKLQS